MATGAITDMHSATQIVTTNKPTPNVLQAGCPSCRRTNSVKALKGMCFYPTAVNSIHYEL